MRRPMHTHRPTLPLCAIFWLTSTAWSVGIAADAPDADKIQSKTLVVNLENPTGVAVHEATGHVFVASRYGVYRFDPKQKDRKKRVSLEISGYPTDVYGEDPKYNIGPLGVAFLGADQLVVADGSRKDGEELVRIYKIGQAAAAKLIKEDTAEITLGPIKAGEQSKQGEGNFFGVAVGAEAIFVTCNGDDTKGWIAKSELKDGKPGELKPAIATMDAAKVEAPVPITFTPDGKELLVGLVGELKEPGDSLLAFFDPKTGELKKTLKPGLSDITGLAYHPKTGKLYATDFSWSDTTKGGLFRIDVEGDKATPTKIIGLDKPTALAFDKDGKLYLTVIGTLDEKKPLKVGDEVIELPGKLLVIDSGL